MTSERVAKVRVKREPGNLYYVKADEEGWLCIYKVKMARGGGRKKKDKKKDDKIINSNKTEIVIE